MLIDRKESLQTTNFDFKSESSMEFRIKNVEKQKLHKNEIIGGLFFLFIYPLAILVITFIYYILNL